VVQVDIRRTLRQTLLIGLVFTVLLATPVAIQQRADARNLASLRQADQERVIKVAAQIIHQEFDAVLSDLRYLSQHNALRTCLEKTDAEHRRRLGLEYLGLARQKRVYDQIRLIGLHGREEVRVDHAEGEPRIRAARELRDKRERYYFQEAQWLSPGEIYVSPFDLNVEDGAVELPVKPTIRFAMPVADNQGLIRGIVVLNYQGRRLIDKLKLLTGQAGEIWLLNAEGYWLIGPERRHEWGFMRPRQPGTQAGDLFPAFWRQAAAEDSGLHRGEDTWIRFERIRPLLGTDSANNVADFAQPVAADRYYWTLAVALSPSAALLANGGDPPRKLWAIYGLLTLFAFAAAGGLAYTLNRNRALGQVMEKVVDSLPLLVSYVDAEQRYRFNNMAYRRLFGLSPRDIYGKTMRQLLGEAAYQDVRPYIEQALAGREVTFERQLDYSGAGMHDVAVSYLPDFSANGEVHGFYVLVNDVSQIKQSERRERQRMLELAHASRLASMGEMATEIAHEINQPLAAIAMYSAASLRSLHGEGDRGQLENWLEAINAQAKRASEIVRRVRRFVRKEELQRGPVDLNRVAGEVAGLLRHEARSQDVEIILRLADDLPLAQGDAVLLEQVVFNLARNAMDAVLPRPHARRITISTSFDPERVQVEVGDTGPGVDPALGDHIFDSFVTGKQEGVGMGLAISRSIIEAHAGTLRYQANADGGATFVFSLPRETTE
jgi:two-component system sensor kinase FixL